MNGSEHDKLACWSVVFIGLFIICTNSFSGKITEAMVKKLPVPIADFEQIVVDNLSNTDDLKKAFRNGANYDLPDYMQVILNYNTDVVNAFGKLKITALNYAITEVNLDVIQILALYKARTDIPDERTIRYSR